MRIAPFFLAVALAAGTAGCVAIDMDWMDDHYETLVRSRNEPPKELNSRAELAPALLDVTLAESFLDLAKRSGELAKEADDPATRIALLRIAALSAWQSYTPEGIGQGTEFAETARAECAQLGATRFQPARDCAIAQIMPMILSGQSVLNDVDVAPPGEPATAAEGERRLAHINKARNIFVDQLQNWDVVTNKPMEGNAPLQQWYLGARRYYACVIHRRLSRPLITVDSELNGRIAEAADALGEKIETAIIRPPNNINNECMRVQLSVALPPGIPALAALQRRGRQI